MYMYIDRYNTTVCTNVPVALASALRHVPNNCIIQRLRLRINPASVDACVHIRVHVYTCALICTSAYEYSTYGSI